MREARRGLGITCRDIAARVRLGGCGGHHIDGKIKYISFIDNLEGISDKVDYQNYVAELSTDLYCHPDLP
jgi:hypothetical protein